MEDNGLRLCDGRQKKNLIINRRLSAAIAKPLLAAGLFHNKYKNEQQKSSPISRNVSRYNGRTRKERLL